ncbi:MBL fold metallo-hydrolase [Zoogloea sp.]|uniref:MBL fold metallo-hydrolase n=1 Tax=Zoogloea sp. TaxID=49181 RepID=UPI00262D88D5|nr:MBL fold metallo-hydrolase [Zoogloea sp.]MDD3352244.1 MBL fold metallo-hydrolase [Zoogloea sp.]
MRSFALALGICLLPVAPAVQAEAPAVGTQVPGFYRLSVGDIEVTALYDGYLDLNSKILKNASPAEIQRLLARQFLEGEKVQTAVNAFLINTSGKLVLVDTGAAKSFGPSLGFVIDNLKAAGYQPEQVAVVLLTHLHGDHINGLLTAEGKPAFPNAEIRVSKADSDFWLSEAVAARKALFARAAKEKLALAGMHLPFPGIGHVRADGKAYAWVPVEFSPFRKEQ